MASTRPSAKTPSMPKPSRRQSWRKRLSASLPFPLLATFAASHRGGTRCLRQLPPVRSLPMIHWIIGLPLRGNRPLTIAPVARSTPCSTSSRLKRSFSSQTMSTGGSPSRTASTSHPPTTGVGPVAFGNSHPFEACCRFTGSTVCRYAATGFSPLHGVAEGFQEGFL